VEQPPATVTQLVEPEGVIDLTPCEKSTQLEGRVETLLEEGKLDRVAPVLEKVLTLSSFPSPVVGDAGSRRGSVESRV